MNEDDYLDSVEVIKMICDAHDKNTLTENQAICHITGTISHDQIKKGNPVKDIKKLCEAYDRRDITKETAIYGILGRLSIIPNLDEIVENTDIDL